MSDIKPGMEVIGADGVPVGIVDGVEAGRFRLKRQDRFGADSKSSRYIENGFVAGVEGDKVRLSANADIAVTLEETRSGRPVDLG
jgi:hypothetical protein